MRTQYEETEDTEEEEPQRRSRRTSERRTQENIEIIEDETFMETSSQPPMTRISKH